MIINCHHRPVFSIEPPVYARQGASAQWTANPSSSSSLADLYKGSTGTGGTPIVQPPPSYQPYGAAATTATSYRPQSQQQQQQQQQQQFGGYQQQQQQQPPPYSGMPSTTTVPSVNMLQLRHEVNMLMSAEFQSQREKTSADLNLLSEEASKLKMSGETLESEMASLREFRQKLLLAIAEQDKQGRELEAFGEVNYFDI